MHRHFPTFLFLLASSPLYAQASTASGVMNPWTAYLLMGLGLALLLAEVFVPSFGALGILGVVCFGLGYFGVIRQGGDATHPLLWILLAMALAFCALAIRAAWKSRGLRAQSGDAALVGLTGRACDVVEASGQVEVRGEIWEAFSRQRVEAGEAVRVLGRVGLKLEVERVS